MRGRLLLVATAFVLVLGLVSGKLWAAGNVLLPSNSASDSGATSTLPNLGLVPSTSSQNTAPTLTETKVQSPPPSQPPVPPIPAADQSTPVPPKESASITTLDKETASHLAPGVIPTTVIHEPDMSSLPAQDSQNKPYTLTLVVSGQSIFGAADIDTISSKLGLSRNQISTNCILAVNGILQTDKGSVPIEGGASPQVTVHYDGTISRYFMAAQAFCIAGKLPPGSGFITEIGNRYSIVLQPINCLPPTRQSSKLLITYNGTDASQCTYQ